MFWPIECTLLPVCLSNQSMKAAAGQIVIQIGSQMLATALKCYHFPNALVFLQYIDMLPFYLGMLQFCLDMLNPTLSCHGKSIMNEECILLLALTHQILPSICSAVQCSAVQSSAVQNSSVHCSAVQCSEILCSAV